MFGRNDFVENVKSALAAVDCDMGAFRSWQKMYDKLKKKKSEQEDRYRRCREQTKRVQEDAQLMEHMLTTAQSVDGKEFGRLLKDLRQMQNSFDHEFLVSKEDQEFHSTYDTILRLLESGISSARQQKRTYETATDRGSRKKYETLQVFLDGQPEHILEQMMEE